jgi:hypothetical protein
MDNGVSIPRKTGGDVAAAHDLNHGVLEQSRDDLAKVLGVQPHRWVCEQQVR